MTKILLTDTIALQNDTVYNSCVKLLPPYRLEKLKKLKHSGDRNLSIAVWMLLRYALINMGIDAAREEFALYPGGKPYIKSRKDIHFSLSHSGDMAMCAISDNKLGADIQLLCDFNEDICRRFFTKHERDYVQKAPPCNKKDRFFEIWTAKEAYCKMTGRGTGDFLNFEIIPGEKPELRHFTNMENVSFKTYSDKLYKAAVCFEGEKAEGVFEKLNFLGLLIK